MADQHLVFVTSSGKGAAGGITAFKLHAETGSLEKLKHYAELEEPFYLALSPDRNYLYSTHAPEDFGSGDTYVAAFQIDAANGSLRKINERSADGITTCYVDVDPTGKALVFANYTSGSVGAFPLEADGSLGEMSSFVQHECGSMVNAARQEAPHAHCSVISPNGRHMFACDLGMDLVRGYALDAATAKLTRQSYVRTIGGGGPRHFTFHPQGGYAYANNEMGNSVNVYRYDDVSGTLIERQVISTVPEDFAADSFTADIKITPNGRYLYCSNRGHDSLAIYAIGSDGCLSLVEIQPSLGNFAQNMAITVDGQLLLCANMLDNGEGESGENVVVFRIDAESGKLSPAQDPVALPGPSCIMIV